MGLQRGRGTAALTQEQKEARLQMVLNTGSRTDIPAYYSQWFCNRIKEGFVLVRNPYYPSQVTRYRLSPEVIDILVFCTKNPEPMIEKLDLLTPYTCVWHVTITPYGKDVEPWVPPKEKVMESLKRLWEKVGSERISWRYDPVFITEKYSVEYHIREFERMAGSLAGYTRQCVVSFIDLYEKTKRNFPAARKVAAGEQRQLVEAFAKAAGRNHMQVHLCCENRLLEMEHVDAMGCLSKEVLEQAAGFKLRVPKKQYARQECRCLLGADIGAYNTCGHGCLYCYANYDRKTVIHNMACHDDDSPFLIGRGQEGDVIRDALQRSWRDGQMSLFDMAWGAQEEGSGKGGGRTGEIEGYSAKKSIDL